jgi:hypothetical protein
VADGGGLENRYGVTPIVGSNPTPSALTSTFASSRPDAEHLAEAQRSRRARCVPYGFCSCPLRDGRDVRRPRHHGALPRADRSSRRRMRSGRPGASPRPALLRSERRASSRHDGDRAGAPLQGRPSFGPWTRPRAHGGPGAGCRSAGRTAGRWAVPVRAASGARPAHRCPEVAGGRCGDCRPFRSALLRAGVTLDDLTAHRHRARTQVDVVEPQCQELAQPQVCPEGEVHQTAEMHSRTRPDDMHRQGGEDAAERAWLFLPLASSRPAPGVSDLGTGSDREPAPSGPDAPVRSTPSTTRVPQVGPRGPVEIPSTPSPARYRQQLPRTRHRRRPSRRSPLRRSQHHRNLDPPRLTQQVIAVAVGRT